MVSKNVALSGRKMKIDFLVVAGLLSFSASIMHLAIIVGGPEWYRFFGAGEEMARMAEQGLLKPKLITFTIALILFVWGAYAWSAAGRFPAFPFVNIVLIVITAVYFLRGIAGLMAPFIDHPQLQQNSTVFWVLSSLICLAFAAVHIKGMLNLWCTD
ncbi:hypothetical protein NBRC116583_33650 [Arenicella sp. 4NH20-0111]